MSTAQSIRLKKALPDLLADDRFCEARLLAMLKQENIVSPTLLAGLPRQIDRTLKHMTARALLTTEKAAKRREICRQISFLAVEENASPLHEPLLEIPLYRDSDPPTRRNLRKAVLRFQRRHKLTTEQAIRLWNGENKEASDRGLWQSCLWYGAIGLPLLLSLAVTLWLGRVFPLILLPVLPALFFPLWEGFSTLTEGGIRAILPSNTLPSLQKSYAPPICALLVASTEEKADRVIHSLEMLISANRESKCLYGLLLILPDAPANQTANDPVLYAPFLKAFEAMQTRTDRPARLLVIERTYLPARKQWKGTPSLNDLLKACAALLKGDERAFVFTAGAWPDQLSPQGLYLAPAQSCLSPDGLRELACTLFHPLCPSDCIQPVLRSFDTDFLPLHDVNSTSKLHLSDTKDLFRRLTQHQVTLQKMGRPLPFQGCGMIKLSALPDGFEAAAASLPLPLSLPLPCALSGASLYTFTPSLVSEYRSLPFNAAHLPYHLPKLRQNAAALLRLPLYLYLTVCPPVSAMVCVFLSFADLLGDLLLSIRFSQSRFFTYTLPYLKKTGRQAIFRLIFPVQQMLHSLQSAYRSDSPLPSALFIGMPVAIGIGTAALLPVPLSLIGLIWTASPLLTALPADGSPPKALAAAERERLLEWSRKSWTFFETQVNADRPLPPAYCIEFPYLRTAAYTTPEAFAFYLIACLCACDLGWIDPFTLERRVSLSLAAWKKLPTKNGLPYARYSVETGDSCRQSPIDTAACGIFALCMAALSAGLAEYAPQNPALDPLSRQAAALWQTMDFGTLYDRSQQTFCKRLLSDGTLWGQIDLLMSTGQAAVFAALAAGQIERSAWKRLRRPALPRGLQSEWGGLEEYFLSSLFLPSADSGLIGQAQKHAWRCQQLNGTDDRAGEHSGEHSGEHTGEHTGERTNKHMGERIFVRASAHTFTPDGGLSEEKIPSGLPDLAVCRSTPPTKLAAPYAAFLALPMLPASAFGQLLQFEKAGALGQYGFYEALDYSASSTGMTVRMWESAHMGQALAAAVNCLKSNAFPQRLMRIPAFGALASLLNEPADCSEGALPVQTVPSSLPLAASSSAPAPNDLTSPVYLLGNSEWGVLWAKGERMLPFYQGQNMAYPSSPHYLYEDGHFTGLLLFQKDRCLSASAKLCKRENGKLTLAFQEAGQSTLAALTFPEKGVLSLELSRSATQPEITALFCYAPPAQSAAPFRLETLPSQHLLIISSTAWTAALAADRLEDLFIHAQEAPQPLGKRYMSRLICQKGSFTEGSLLTPACQIGGTLPAGSAARILLAFGQTKEEVLRKIDRARAFYPDPTPNPNPIPCVPNPSALSLYSQLPLPDSNGSSASYALTMQLQFLFEQLKLRPVTVFPSTEKEDEESPSREDYAHLHRCLNGALHLLQKRQFETDDQPVSLPEKGNTATDELLKSCLLPLRRAELTAPPMPERTRIRLNEERLMIEKGQDLPPVCRTYTDRLCAFLADSYTPAFRFYGADAPTPIILTLPSAHSPVRPSSYQPMSDGRSSSIAEAPASSVLSLFAAAEKVTYTPEGVCYTGDEYTVNVHLLPKWHALLLNVAADGPAAIRLNRPAPDKSEDGTDFWHQKNGNLIDFCSKLTGEGQTVFLLGSFRPSADRTYYLLREELNARMLRRLPLFESVSPFPASKLVWQSPPPYPTPLIVHPVFSSDTPAAFPLRLFYIPEQAFPDLIRLFSGNDRTAQIAACLLWAKTTGNTDALRQKLPRPIGRESIYLSAARALEALYAERMAFIPSDENSPTPDTPPFPLLPYLSAAFAELAHEMGDYSGEALYRSWQFPTKPSAQAEDSRQDSAAAALPKASQSDRPTADRTDRLERIACQLLSGDSGGTTAWMAQIQSLPLFPEPEEAAALWALFWYGVMGYSETPEGFSLRPLLCGAFEGCAFTLRQKDTLYRVDLKRGDTASCLLDGAPYENRFLFDKKTHFLEITVENFERKV